MNKATFTCKTALAFAVGAAVFLPSFADRNITANITLNEDTDWTSDGTVNLSNGAVVDLNGHDLRVAGLSGTGRFISSEEELIDNGSFEDIVGATSSSSQEFSETVYPKWWTSANATGGSLGVCNSNDPTWSKGLDAQNGGRSIWWWCAESGARGGATLTKNVVVDKKGIYHLSFYVAARPLFEDITNNKYKNMRVYVDIDGKTIGYAVCTDAVWEEATFDVLLDAGNRSITFRSDATYGNRQACGLLDNVSLRRKSSLRLGASAAGVYSCQNVSVDGNITVLAESQTLNGDCDWSGLGNVNIAAGATIDLAGQNLSMNGLTYDTAARLCDTELIKNGSFETDTEPWTLQDAASGASVFLSSDWCENSKDGSRHMAFWNDRNTYAEATVSREVDIPVSGAYRLSCYTRKRHGDFPATTIKMIVDDVVLRSVETQSSWQPAAVDVVLTAGKHKVAFASSQYDATNTPGGGIDLVSLRFSDAAITNSNNEAVSELHVNIASGSVSNDKIALGGNLKLVKDLAEDLAMPVQSTMDFGSDGWTLNLATHKLSVSLPNGVVLIVKYPKIENGTIAATAPNKQGWIKFGAPCDVDASLEVNCAMAIDAADIRVKNYVVNYDGPDSSGGKEMAVYGTFKPNTDKFYGCTMLDQSTLDLSGRTSALPAEAAFTGGKPSRLSVSFQKDATVSVHVDGRTDLSELARTKVNDAYAGYLMKWNTRPDASVKFILDGDAAKKYRLVCTDEGLVLRPPFGFMILMR